MRTLEELQQLEGAGAENKSRLAEALLLLFAWGLVSASSAQWLAQCALDDGLRHPEIAKLASIGKHGEFSGNCRRDLIRRCLSRCRVACVTRVWMPVKTAAEEMIERAISVISQTVSLSRYTCTSALCFRR